MFAKLFRDVGAVPTRFFAHFSSALRKQRVVIVLRYCVLMNQCRGRARGRNIK